MAMSWTAAIFPVLALAAVGADTADAEVNVYSHRHYPSGYSVLAPWLKGRARHDGRLFLLFTRELGDGRSAARPPDHEEAAMRKFTRILTLGALVTGLSLSGTVLDSRPAEADLKKFFTFDNCSSECPIDAEDGDCCAIAPPIIVES